MKRAALFLGILFITCLVTQGQEDIFKKHGITKEPLTLSKGKYKETFYNEEIMQVGTVLINTHTNKVVKFLEEDTTKLAYRAEATSRFLTVDPLAEKYYSWSPYVYCLNNPLRYIDPTGREVIAMDDESRRNITNTLSKDEAKYVKFRKDGSIDTKRLNKSKSTSENFTALKTLANSETKYKFVVSEKDVNGKSFTGENAENYYYGLTAVPDPDPAGSKSPDGDVWIYTSSFLSEGKQAENTAHEGYGHAYFYDLNKTDKTVDPWHRWENQSVLEWDSELKMNVPIVTFSPANKKLEDQIKTVTTQARKNYDSRKKK